MVDNILLLRGMRCSLCFLSVSALLGPLLGSWLNRDWPGRGGLSGANLVLYNKIHNRGIVSYMAFLKLPFSVSTTDQLVFFFLLANARRVLPFWGCFGNGLGYGILSFVPSHPNLCYKVIRVAIEVNILDLSGI